MSDSLDLTWDLCQGCWVCANTLAWTLVVSVSLRESTLNPFPVQISFTSWLVQSAPVLTGLERNAECPPLECWECDSWIPACFSSPTVFQDKPKQVGCEIRNKALSSMHSGLNRTKSWAAEYFDVLKSLLLLNHYLGTCRQPKNRRPCSWDTLNN